MPDSTPPLAGTPNLCVDPRSTPLAHVLRSRRPRLYGLPARKAQEAARRHGHFPGPRPPDPRARAAGNFPAARAKRTVAQLAVRERAPTFPRPRPAWPSLLGTYRAARRPGPEAERVSTERGAGGASRACSLRLRGHPGPRRSLRHSARPRRRPDKAPLGRTHGARRRRHRPGHAHQVSAPGPRPPKHRGALKGDAARPRPDGRGPMRGGALVGVVRCGRGSGRSQVGLPGSAALPAPQISDSERVCRVFHSNCCAPPGAMVSLASTALPRPGLTHTDLAQALCGHLWHSETCARSLARLPQKLRCQPPGRVRSAEWFPPHSR